MSTCAGPATEVSSATKKLNADSERQLIVRAKNGDEAAFAALFDAHKKRVYSICLRMTGNIAQAQRSKPRVKPRPGQDRSARNWRCVCPD